MLRFAMLGAGRIAHAHVKSFATNPAAQLVWVADPLPGAAEGLAAAAGAKATLDPLEAINDPSVDAVLICTPTPTHVDNIIAAVSAGKAVLCEKPIDLSLERVGDLFAALEGKNPRVQMGFNRRFDPSFADIHARVEAGEIGNVEQIVVISRDPAAPPRQYVEDSGGIFKDMTIHDFDMVRFFLPDIVEVKASGQNVIEPFIEEVGDFDSAVVTLRSSSGAIATIVNSRRCDFGYDQRLEVFGERGMLQAGNRFFEDPDGRGIELPYIAAWHQAPVHEFRDDLHLHLEFFSILRAPNKLKYLAGSESGMAAWISDTTPEAIADRLREVW